MMPRHTTQALQLYVSSLKPRFASEMCFIALEHATLEDQGTPRSCNLICCDCCASRVPPQTWM